MEDKLFKYLLTFISLICILILIFIIVFLSYNAIIAIKKIGLYNFFKLYWVPDSINPKFGILSALASSFLVTIIAFLIAWPIGFCIAVFIAEFAKGYIRKILKFIIELLASIPSVVLGFLGIVIFGPFIKNLFNLDNSLNAFLASLLLSLMVLPTIISILDDYLTSVDKNLKLASLALGANKIQTLFYITIPAAKTGFLLSAVLSLGRIIGETMTVLMVAGCSSQFPTSIFSPVKTITATIASELGEVVYKSNHYYALFFLAFILFFVSFIFNIIADFIIYKKEKW